MSLFPGRGPESERSVAALGSPCPAAFETNETWKQVSSMAREHGQGDPAYYEIRVQGRLDSQWTEWFDGLTISHDSQGDTWLGGVVTDQAALYSLISRARDLGLTLLSVNRRPQD